MSRRPIILIPPTQRNREEDIRLALNNYLEAIARNPDSPAQGAYNMAIRILDFYNKDMYNH